MRAWIKERWSILLTCILIQTAITFLFTATGYLLPVKASSSSPPEISECVVVAETIAHTISRCEDVDMDNVFYMNELGLPMVPWEK